MVGCHILGLSGVFMSDRSNEEDTVALRIQKAELPAQLRESLIEQIGAVPEPAEVTWNNPKLAEALQEFTAQTAGFDGCDAGLKTFAHMAVAAQIGCSWCLGINYFLAQHQSLDLVKASQVPRWRASGGHGGSGGPVDLAQQGALAIRP
jgi:alkylhydroperoxidase family enzyme